MRWQTADPLGFADGLNLYAYVRNNPHCYIDPDGRFVFLLPLFTIALDTAAFAIALPTLEVLAGAAIGGALGVAVYQVNKWYDNKYNQEMVEGEVIGEQENIEVQEKKGRKRGKDNAIKGGPPRDPNTANYLPDPAAEGSAHTTLGIKKGTHGPYTQGATFNEKGEFKGRTDVTDHNRYDHPNPHYHPATGPNAADSPAQPIIY